MEMEIQMSHLDLFKEMVALEKVVIKEVRLRTQLEQELEVVQQVIQVMAVEVVYLTVQLVRMELLEAAAAEEEEDGGQHLEEEV